MVVLPFYAGDIANKISVFDATSLMQYFISCLCNKSVDILAHSTVCSMRELAEPDERIGTERKRRHNALIAHSRRKFGAKHGRLEMLTGPFAGIIDGDRLYFWRKVRRASSSVI